MGDEDPATGIPTTYYAAVQLTATAEVVDDPAGKAAILRLQQAAGRSRRRLGLRPRRARQVAARHPRDPAARHRRTREVQVRRQCRHRAPARGRAPAGRTRRTRRRRGTPAPAEAAGPARPARRGGLIGVERQAPVGLLTDRYELTMLSSFVEDGSVHRKPSSSASPAGCRRAGATGSWPGSAGWSNCSTGCGSTRPRWAGSPTGSSAPPPPTTCAPSGSLRRRRLPRGRDLLPRLAGPDRARASSARR